MGNIIFTEDQKLQLSNLNNPSIKKFDEDTIRAIFGHEAAEDETIDRLKQYYVKTEIFNRMRSKLPLLILVGHKGVGKSALLKVLSIEDEITNIIPITILPNEIISIDTSDGNFLRRIETWKDGISNIIFDKLINSINDKLKKADKHLIIKDFSSKFGDIIFTLLGQKINEIQKNNFNLSSSQFIKLFNNELFKKQPITIYLDDLDRGWQNTDNDIKNLSAMINAIRDLSRSVKNLRFRIALRSDVYYAVRTSDETTDKIDGSVLWQYWTNHEILVMLIKRILTYFNQDVDEDYLLNSKQSDISLPLEYIFDKTFHGSGHWKNAPIHRVLMSLIRKRPRDLVKLCTLSARNAYTNKHKKIMTQDLEKSFPNYSYDRLTDVSTEYKSELPQIMDLLLKMKPTKKELSSSNPNLYSREQLLKKLENILSMSHYTFKDNKITTPQSLAAFLFKINFLTARIDTSTGPKHIYYDENRYIYNEFTDFGYSYEIHPAYRWALQPNNITDLYKQIEL